VVSAAVRLKDNPGRRRRVTVRSIGLELRMHTLLQVNLDKLPRTKAALKAHVESTEEFALRRIHWAKDNFIMNRVRATRSDIMRAAGIGSSTYHMAPVRQAITDAKEYLDSGLDRAVLSISHAT
jgi:hypothetical protein